MSRDGKSGIVTLPIVMSPAVAMESHASGMPTLPGSAAAHRRGGRHDLAVPPMPGDFPQFQSIQEARARMACQPDLGIRDGRPLSGPSGIALSGMPQAHECTGWPAACRCPRSQAVPRLPADLDGRCRQGRARGTAPCCQSSQPSSRSTRTREPASVTELGGSLTRALARASEASACDS